MLQQWFTPKTLPSFLRSASVIDGTRAHSIVIQAAKNHQLSADCFFSEMSYGNSAGAPELYIRPKGVAYISGGSDDVPLPELADEVSYDPRLTKELQRQAAVVSPEYLDVSKDADLKAEQAVRGCASLPSAICPSRRARRRRSWAGTRRWAFLLLPATRCGASTTAWAPARLCPSCSLTARPRARTSATSTHRHLWLDSFTHRPDGAQIPRAHAQDGR